MPIDRTTRPPETPTLQWRAVALTGVFALVSVLIAHQLIVASPIARGTAQWHAAHAAGTGVVNFVIALLSRTWAPRTTARAPIGVHAQRAAVVSIGLMFVQFLVMRG